MLLRGAALAALTALCSDCGDDHGVLGAQADTNRPNPGDVTSAGGVGGSAASDGGDARDIVDANVVSDASDANGAPDSGAFLVIPVELDSTGGPLRILKEGDSIHLLQPLQGGHVVFLGAQAKNFPSDTARIRVRFRRPDTGFIVGEESRTVAMKPAPEMPDTWQPDGRLQSQVANVPLCPDYDPEDVVDRLALVEFEVTALYTDPPAIGTASLHLTPTCDPSDPTPQLCRCECQANYVLGKCAPPPRGGDAAAP